MVEILTGGAVIGETRDHRESARPTAGIRAAFDGGEGVTVCPPYVEMSLVRLEAAGHILQELGRG